MLRLIRPFLPVLLFAFVACTGGGVPDAAHNSRNSLDWAGVYRAALPCADCEGIDARVTLNADNTYAARYRYLGRDTVYNRNGHFTWDAAGGTVTLHEEGAPGTHYRVGENRLTQLDLDGNPIMGGFADKYVFHKVPDASLTETYWKLVELRGRPVEPSRNEAHIILKDEDSRVIGSGGCNRIIGGYTLDGRERIAFSQMAGTMMACSDGMETEGDFLRTLMRAGLYDVKGDTLTLSTPRLKPILRFEAVYLH